MSNDITAEDVKRIRQRYGLSQKAFAQLLGLGDASIVRYENGTKPSKANANLIRAAELPEFMAGCLERDGGKLSEAQRQQVEKVVYAEVSLNEEGEMDINEVYELTLQQEVLNEKAALIMSELINGLITAEAEGDEVLALAYDDMLTQISYLKPTIATSESMSTAALAKIDGRLSMVQDLMAQSMKRAA